MFIDKLNAVQQAQLLTLAEKVAQADHKDLEEAQEHWNIEKKFLDILQKQCEPDIKPSEVNLASLSEVFDTNISKVALLLELIGMGYASGEYHKNQKEVIDEVANALNINQDIISDLENWVTRQFALLLEASVLMEEK
jgi:hypothetical protein